jgi:hypothetical protein
VHRFAMAIGLERRAQPAQSVESWLVSLGFDTSEENDHDQAADTEGGRPEQTEGQTDQSEQHPGDANES